MKRVRIMLLSLFVLAAVGSVLAFKAKEELYCIYSEVEGPNGITCPLIAKPSTYTLTTNIVPPNYYVTDNDDCPNTVAVALCTQRVFDVDFDD